ncbi:MULTISPECIES: hypothetical protein [unclassified Modestobacter]|uniref:hypothetical protein n=1 Tax=unclassified Modestobacter TaxID=2643866 RepID=UPI0022AADC06|nr:MULTISPECIES: hypothetical protein [unclassified Modestobacter]MCZ2822859.1 hypothetical protein [Modestobacter sp. VKM Ac-2981]MCZ2851105.1 hypothetical protein [Modestobacter sp. VKM Ac-2982]
MKQTRPITKLLLAGSLVVAPFTLAACGDDTAGPEEDVSVGDIQEDEAVDADADAGLDAGAEAGLGYDGLYDSAFYAGSSDYVGQEVTVSATVDEVFGPNSFSIAGTEDTSVEPLLVVGADSANALEGGEVVQVTGTVQSGFTETGVEDELGIDLTDDAFADFEDQQYIVADSVDTSVPTETE